MSRLPSANLSRFGSGQASEGWRSTSFERTQGKDADGRAKPGHDGWWMRVCRLMVFALALLGVAPCRAEPAGSGAEQPVPVRVGDHPDFGRIVFDFAGPASWHIARNGAQVTLQFDPASTIAAAPSLPRNVVAMSQDAGGVEITVAPGARLRTMRLDNRLVLDVLDPLPEKPLPAAAAPMHLPAKLLRPDLPIDRHEASLVVPAVATAPLAPRLPTPSPPATSLAASPPVAAAPLALPPPIQAAPATSLAALPPVATAPSALRPPTQTPPSPSLAASPPVAAAASAPRPPIQTHPSTSLAALPPVAAAPSALRPPTQTPPSPSLAASPPVAAAASAPRPPIQTHPATSLAASSPPPRGALTLEAGSGRVVSLGGPAANVFVADPKVAEVRPASPTVLFVFGLAPGRTTIAALDSAGHLLAEEEVVVEPSHYAASAAQSALVHLLPGSRIQVSQTGRTLLLSGSVASPEQAAQAVNIVRGFAPDASGVVNQLAVRGRTQVTLAVRMVETDRNITRSLGINWTALGQLGSIGKLPALNGALNGGTSAACAAGPIGSVLCGGLNLSAMIDALASDGLVHVLAEPNLTVMSGEPAHFLVGGEFPIPVGQQNGQVTVEFKRYGVQLSFVPTVLDDGRIDLKVAPEVSQLTTQGAVQVPAGNASITIPALTVRSAETTVELGSGESFAIAGLLQDSSTRTNSGLPALRNIPAVGTLFGTTSYQVDRTELVILVTPLISRPVDDPSALKAPDNSPVAAASPTMLVPLPASMQRAGLPSGTGFIVQ